MRKYYRVMLGKKSVHAEECLAGGFLRPADRQPAARLTGKRTLA